ncbi:PLP-dependent aspartate aminotransferase family protein [Fulvivirga maritima]|uniref:trans-sulfuration enzyme family protein n=1 Tax=Fulvivirga maritima TaxID=2904247 RepID=UPI001F2703E4|nr:PLP-dependent aspartate aminotransferase family protein [Fulvivirga maritima]UII28029.1 PLP-dependent aspartate aminotransferase family protein [Fulvivirga maritima]
MNQPTSKATACVHAGSKADTMTKGVNTPVFTSTAYDYLDVDVHAYPRYFNTINQQVVSDKIAALEKGEKAMVFSSGMAAITTALFSILKTGDHAIFQNDLYGGTHHAITNELNRFGIEFTLVNSLSASDFEKAIQPNTKLIYIETPSNPLLKIIDIRAISTLAKANNLITLIDNTFASPINQNPIELGIDIVLHSGTKYLGGHSDLCCGAIISSEELMQKAWSSAIHFGGNLDAQSCYLLERSIKTLSLRVKQQNLNAHAISKFLEGHSEISNVYYPGLSTHPQHDLATSQMSGYGGMLSFEVKIDPDAFVKRLKLIAPAMSLGGVESTITSPAQTSHSKISDEEKEKAGISNHLLRLSVGIEEADDLINDLNLALHGNT